MMNSTKKAIERLKSFALFSEDFETFRGLFFDNLDKSREDEAIELLIRVNFELLKSKGEIFNDLLEKVDDTERKKLIVWIDEMVVRFGLSI